MEAILFFDPAIFGGFKRLMENLLQKKNGSYLIFWLFFLLVGFKRLMEGLVYEKKNTFCCIKFDIVFEAKAWIF